MRTREVIDSESESHTNHQSLYLNSRPDGPELRVETMTRVPEPFHKTTTTKQKCKETESRRSHFTLIFLIDRVFYWHSYFSHLIIHVSRICSEPCIIHYILSVKNTDHDPCIPPFWGNRGKNQEPFRGKLRSNDSCRYVQRVMYGVEVSEWVSEKRTRPSSIPPQSPSSNTVYLKRRPDCPSGSPRTYFK